MDIVDKLAEYFAYFPGIGERQSKRFVYFLLSSNPHYVEELSKMLLELKKEILQCEECFRFFNTKNYHGGKICDICASPNVDTTLLMIIEKDSDLESIKKSRFYNGKYFVLGGLVPIVEKSTPKKIRIEELKNKIKEQSKNGLKEVVLAFSLNPQGEHTDMYLRNQLGGILETLDITITSLGRGLSTGTELEYSDNDTIKNALKNRQ